MSAQPTPETTAAAIRELRAVAREYEQALPGNSEIRPLRERRLKALTLCADLLDAQARQQHEACPCLHTTPCYEDCTCVKPISSRGCRRCCSYGSKEQQRKMAEHLVASEARLQEALTNLSASWRARYQVSLDYDRKHGLRDVTTELGGMVYAADELDAILHASPATPAPDAPEAQQVKLRARIRELEQKHGTAESCGWHDGMEYTYDMEVAAALNELRKLLAPDPPPVVK